MMMVMAIAARDIPNDAQEMTIAAMMCGPGSVISVGWYEGGCSTEGVGYLFRPFGF